MGENNLPIVNGDLELVTVVGKNIARYTKNEQLVVIQEKAVNDLFKVIDDTPKTISNALVLESYAKTLTTLKNKIDKKRKEIKDILNQEGEEVHAFFQTKFIKPIESKIAKLKKDILDLTTPIEVETIEEGKKEVSSIPTHQLILKCDTVILAKVLAYLTQNHIEYEIK